MLRLSTELDAEILSVHLTAMYTSKNESDLFLQREKRKQFYYYSSSGQSAFTFSIV